MALKVELTNDIRKLERQIKALKSVIPNDIPKDREIHSQALRALQEHRKQLLCDGGI